MLIADDFRWGLVVLFPMQIVVSLVSGETLSVDVMRSDHLELVEDRIWDAIKREPPDLNQRQVDRMTRDVCVGEGTSPHMKLIFGTTVLSIYRTIASYGIPNGAALTCIFTADFDMG